MFRDINPEDRLKGANPKGLTSSEVEDLRAKFGFNEVVAAEVPEWKVYLMRFCKMVPVIMTITAILSVTITENGKYDYLSFGILVFELFLTVTAAHMSDRSAKSALDAVKAMATPTIYARRNGEAVQINTRELVPGDVILVRAGTILPADGIVIGQGQPMYIDESTLTGETEPVSKGYAANVMSGSVIQRGELDVLVTKTGEESTMGKTLKLIGSVQSPGNLRIVLAKAASIIVYSGAVFCFALFLVTMIRDDRSFGAALKLAFAVLSAVAPTAMPVVTATVLSIGARIIASENAIVQRLSAIEELAGMEILCSDKTGTLTLNQLTLKTELLYTENNYSVDTMLLYAALASNIDHAEPIDKIIIKHTDMKEHAKYTVKSMIPFDPVNKKVISTIVTPKGETFRVIKGAPHIIRDITCNPLVLGEERAAEEKLKQNEVINERASRGFRTLGVCVEISPPEGVNVSVHDVGVCQLVGYLCMYDPPRSDTKAVVEEANRLGVDVKMITGDQLAIAIETSRSLGMGTNIASSEVFNLDTSATPFMNCENFSKYCESVSGFAGVYPEHKFKVVQSLMEGGNLIGMTGDGVNDAPALKAATVGIAVAGATEAACSAADIVLKAEGLSTIITAIKLSRQIFRRIESYIIYRIASSVFIMLFFFLSIVAFDFYMPTWVVLFISVANDITIMFTSKDNVPTAEAPVHWDMLRCSIVGSVVGTIGSGAALLMLALVHPRFIDWWSMWGLDSYGTWNDSTTDEEKRAINGIVVCALYVCIGMIIQTNFLIARARGIWCKFGANNFVPHHLVGYAMGVTVILAIVLAILWPADSAVGGGLPMSGLREKHDDETGLLQCLIIMLYTLIWFCITDLVKSAIYWNWNKVQLMDSDEIVDLDPKSEEAQKKRNALRKLQRKLQNKNVEAEGVHNKAARHEMMVARLASTASMDGAVIGDVHGRVMVRRGSSGEGNVGAQVLLELAEQKQKCAALEEKLARLEAKLEAVLSL